MPALLQGLRNNYADLITYLQGLSHRRMVALKDNANRLRSRIATEAGAEMIINTELEWGKIARGCL